MVENKKKSRWKYVILGIIIMMFTWNCIFLQRFQDFSGAGIRYRVCAERAAIYSTALAFYAIFMFITGRYIERDLIPGL